MRIFTTNRFSLRKQRTMKQIFSSVLFLFFLANLPAQTPLYLSLTRPVCTNWNTNTPYSGQDMLMYSINKGENELYFFKIGSNPQISTQAMPKGMVSCQTAVLNSTEVNSIRCRRAARVHRSQGAERIHLYAGRCGRTNFPGRHILCFSFAELRFLSGYHQYRLCPQPLPAWRGLPGLSYRYARLRLPASVCLPA